MRSLRLLKLEAQLRLFELISGLLLLLRMLDEVSSCAVIELILAKRMPVNTVKFVPVISLSP
jgi:hypothetical protein